jgi:hypothetical protein
MHNTKKEQPKEMSKGCFTGFMLFFVVISLGLLYWGYHSYEFTSTVISDHILVEGEVIDINVETRNAGNSRQAINKTAPVLQFVYQGDTIQFSSEQYSDVVDYEIGEKVGVYVNTEKPTESIINTWMEKWGSAAFLFALGGIFFLISALSILSSFRK